MIDKIAILQKVIAVILIPILLITYHPEESNNISALKDVATAAPMRPYLGTRKIFNTTSNTIAPIDIKAIKRSLPMANIT